MVYKSLQCETSHFHNFQECSGLNLKLEKSEIIPCEPKRKSQIELPNVVVNYLLILVHLSL